MNTIYLLISLGLSLAWLFKDKFINFDDFVNSAGAFVLLSIIALLIVLVPLSAMLSEPVKIGEYPIVKINGNYFKMNSDKYGKSTYNVAFNVEGAVCTRTFDTFHISSEPKVVMHKEKTKLGSWGFDWINNNQYSIDVYVPESSLENIQQIEAK